MTKSQSGRLTIIIAVFGIMLSSCQPISGQFEGLGLGQIKVQAQEDGGTTQYFGESYIVSVDYNRTFDEMVKAGHYSSSVDYRIVEANFPIHRPNPVGPAVIAEVVFIDLSTFKGSTAELFQYVDSLGLRAVKVEEFLAFGEIYPEVQRNLSIIGFELYWNDPVNDNLSLYLGAYSGRRILSFVPTYYVYSNALYLTTRK